MLRHRGDVRSKTAHKSGIGVSKLLGQNSLLIAAVENCLMSKLLCWHTFFESVLLGRPLFFLIDFSNVKILVVAQSDF